jgi:hypothetical protein
MSRNEFQRFMDIIAPIDSADASGTGAAAEVVAEAVLRSVMSGSRMADTLHPTSATNDISTTGMLHDLTQSGEAAEFWVLLQAVNFIVYNKLRTPYGGPAQTLEAIEKTLQRVVASASSTSDATARKHATVARLLKFFDVLEKHIYLAYEGSVTTLINLPLMTVSFFRTNRKVCVDWFARIRPRLMAAAAAVPHAPSDSIRYAFATRP